MPQTDNPMPEKQLPHGFSSAPWAAVGTDTNTHAHIYDRDGETVAAVSKCPARDETHMDRAKVMTAAGTTAQQLAEIGYDPLSVFEDLTLLLQAVHSRSLREAMNILNTMEQ